MLQVDHVVTNFDSSVGKFHIQAPTLAVQETTPACSPLCNLTTSTTTPWTLTSPDTQCHHKILHNLRLLDVRIQKLLKLNTKHQTLIGDEQNLTIFTDHSWTMTKPWFWALSEKPTNSVPPSKANTFFSMEDSTNIPLETPAMTLKRMNTYFGHLQKPTWKPLRAPPPPETRKPLPLSLDKQAYLFNCYCSTPLLLKSLYPESLMEPKVWKPRSSQPNLYSIQLSMYCFPMICINLSFPFCTSRERQSSGSNKWLDKCFRVLVSSTLRSPRILRKWFLDTEKKSKAKKTIPALKQTISMAVYPHIVNLLWDISVPTTSRSLQNHSVMIPKIPKFYTSTPRCNPL